MLVDRYTPEDVLARVPEVAQPTDPVRVRIDHLLEEDVLVQRVKADLAPRYPQTTRHGRPATPVAVILRRLVVKHLYDGRREL